MGQYFKISIFSKEMKQISKIFLQLHKNRKIKPELYQKIKKTGKIGTPNNNMRHRKTKRGW